MVFQSFWSEKGYRFLPFGFKKGMVFVSSLEFGMFFRRSYFLIIIDKTFNKVFSQCL